MEMYMEICLLLGNAELDSRNGAALKKRGGVTLLLHPLKTTISVCPPWKFPTSHVAARAPPRWPVHLGRGYCRSTGIGAERGCGRRRDLSAPHLEIPSRAIYWRVPRTDERARPGARPSRTDPADPALNNEEAARAPCREHAPRVVFRASPRRAVGSRAAATATICSSPFSPRRPAWASAARMASPSAGPTLHGRVGPALQGLRFAADARAGAPGRGW